MDANPVRGDIARRLRSTFASVADAFFCMASDSDAALTAADLAAGLARAGLNPLAARAALAEAGLPPPPNDPAVPAVLALEFCAAFTWHELNDLGLAPDSQA
jgi:acetyl-CoA acetyltransferase